MVNIASYLYIRAGRFGNGGIGEALKRVDAVFQDVAMLPVEEKVFLCGGGEEVQKRYLEGVGEVWMVPLTRIYATTRKVFEEIASLLKKEGVEASFLAVEERNNILPNLYSADIEVFMEHVWYLPCFERICP